MFRIFDTSTVKYPTPRVCPRCQGTGGRIFNSCYWDVCEKCNGVQTTSTAHVVRRYTVRRNTRRAA